MPVVSTTPTTALVEVGGRDIRIVEDKKTQSVNVCTPENRDGVYEQVFYFCGQYRVKAEEVGRYTELADAVKFLRGRLGDQVRRFSQDASSES